MRRNTISKVIGINKEKGICQTKNKEVVIDDIWLPDT